MHGWIKSVQVLLQKQNTNVIKNQLPIAVMPFLHAMNQICIDETSCALTYEIFEPWLMLLHIQNGH